MAEPRLGVSLGRYRVIHLLGAGGMAEVFLAHDPRLGRDVAIKVLGEQLVNRPGYRAFLQREARAVARLNHPHIVQVYDVIEFRERVCLVEEYVKGSSLSDRLRQGPLPLNETIRLAAQITAAMVHAHGRGVLHCDLKPSNVLLTAAGDAKVVDFGLARPLSDATDADRDLGASATLIENGAGTPAYMAPEQHGRRPLDARSDIYSFGVMLAEMVTGHRPIGPWPQTPASPSDETTHEWHPVSEGVPVRLAPIITRALALDPANRYQSALELLADLESAGRHDLGGMPAVGAPTVANERPQRQRRRAITSLGIDQVLLLVTGLALGVCFLGWLNSSWFNVILGRQAFATESVGDWFRWGLKSVVAPGGLATILLTVAAALRPVLAFGFQRGLPRFTTRLTAIGHRWGLDQGGVLAGLVAIGGLVALTLTWLRFNALLTAFVTPNLSTADPGTFSLLSQVHYLEHRYYRQVLTVIVVIMATGLAAAWRRRAPGSRTHGSFRVALAVLGLAVVSLDVPYRLLYHGDAFPRVRLGALDCFELGTSASDVLLYCPDSPVPRNRTLPKNDPRVERLSCAGNVFDDPMPCDSVP
ncbi:MAG: serine/threonine-protein kinase [Vicinamibacterales bacterium]